MTTNILILAIHISLTNAFNFGASTPTGAWATQNSHNAAVTCAAPAGVYHIEYKGGTAEEARPITHTNHVSHKIITTGWVNSNWEKLGHASFTNSVYRTNTIVFPIPPEPTKFFKLVKGV